MSTAPVGEKPESIPLQVLIVEDRETDTELIVRELKKHGFAPSWERVDTEADFLTHINRPYDLITADAIMPQFSALRVVSLLQEHQLDIPCIVISGSIGEEEAVALIRAGAADYLMKDRLGRLGQAIRHVLEQHRLREDNRQAHKSLIALNEELERRIAERTAKLQEVNEQLAQELTERKQIELRLRQQEVMLERRVTTRTAQLERSRTRLRRLVSELTLTEQRERKQLASELHDYLAQLLVVSKLKVGQYQKDSSDPRNRGLLQDAESLIDQALTYSRTLVAQLSPTVLFTQGLVASLRWLADHFSHQGLCVQVTAQVDAVPLPEDHSVLIFQSVRELLFNVLKHAGTGQARLDVIVPDEQTLRITVSDCGPGFDVGSVGGEAKGFGLFSIQERIEGLSGTFSAFSTPNTGTRIELSVPLSHEPLPVNVSTARPPTTEGQPDDASSPRCWRALVVDDHALIRQELTSFLTSLKNIQVVGDAADGRKGVELARTLCPDLVLMDVNMPGMDGIEATRELLSYNPAIKVIGVTVNNAPEIHTRMKQAGAVDSMTKDRLAHDLASTIARVMGRVDQLSTS